MKRQESGCKSQEKIEFNIIRCRLNINNQSLLYIILYDWIIFKLILILDSCILIQ